MVKHKHFTNIKSDLFEREFVEILKLYHDFRMKQENELSELCLKVCDSTKELQQAIREDKRFK